jgi:hypothetical protein
VFVAARQVAEKQETLNMFDVLGSFTLSGLLRICFKGESGSMLISVFATT